jgi:hypothetical protein
MKTTPPRNALGSEDTELALAWLFGHRLEVACLHRYGRPLLAELLTDALGRRVSVANVAALLERLPQEMRPQ